VVADELKANTSVTLYLVENALTPPDSFRLVSITLQMSAPKKQKGNNGKAIARGSFEHVIDEVTETGGRFRALAFRDRATTSNKELIALSEYTEVDSLDLSGTKVSSIGFAGFMKAYTLKGGVGIRKIVVYSDSSGNVASERLTVKYLEEIVGRCAHSLEELHLSLPGKIKSIGGLSRLSQCKTMHLFFKGMHRFALPSLRQVTNLTIEAGSITYFEWAEAARAAAKGFLAGVESLTLKDNLMQDPSFRPLAATLLRQIVTPLTALRELHVPVLRRNADFDATIQIADDVGLDRRNLHLWAPVPLLNDDIDGDGADAEDADNDNAKENADDVDFCAGDGIGCGDSGPYTPPCAKCGTRAPGCPSCCDDCGYQ
jgi:hypothetical protein